MRYAIPKTHPGLVFKSDQLIKFDGKKVNLVFLEKFTTFSNPAVNLSKVY